MSAEQDEILARWERAAAGWRKQADVVRDFGMPVSAWMVDQLWLQPGQRVLELAAGPGDTGFLAAELVRPGGALISSDAVEAMLEIARERAAAIGLEEVEFKLLELDWIDLPTASVDAAVCRWGLMFAADRAAALQEIRRVLRPGGRAALAVWDAAEHNPWATIPVQTLVELGHIEPPDPNAPGMFVLGDAARLREMIEAAGFVEVLVEQVELPRSDDSVDAYLDQTVAISRPIADARERLSVEQWAEVVARVAQLAEPFTAEDGSLRFPARTLAAAASA